MKVGTDGVMLGAWADVTGAERILDIGTGTGLNALMLAQRSCAAIDAIEPDPASFHQAKDNIMNCSWKDRIRIYLTTLQDFHIESDSGESKDRKYDLIVSNPPYFSGSGKNPDERKALSRHADTLTRTELITGIESLLSGQGKFCVILPLVEAGLFLAEATTRNLYCTRKLNMKPLPGREVKRVLMQFEREEKSPEEEILVIETGGRHEYSKEYIELTRDFYLAF